MKVRIVGNRNRPRSGHRLSDTRDLRAAAYAAVLALVSVFSSQARADAPTEQSSSEDTLAEVVVTAEKRDSTIQKTPISITAITGEQLQAQGITNMLEVAQETPGVSFRTAGPGQTEFEVRGLSSSGGSSATVGFYLDEMPISAPATGSIGKVVIDPNLYDLNRVEVLRGPQGTLYGSGSMGGTIKLVTNSAKLNVFEASADADVSSTDGGGFNRSGDALVNIPLISDLAALRLVVTSNFTDGWIDRIVVNPFPFPSNNGCTPTAFSGCARGNVLATPASQIIPHSNASHLNAVRLNLFVQPSDKLKITTSAMYQGLATAGYSNFDIPPGTDGPQAHYQPFNFAEPSDDVFKYLSVVIAYDFTGAQLTSATSYSNRDLTQLQDQSENYQAVYSLPFFPPDLGIEETDRIAQFSQELRISSTGDSAFQWLGGGFFSTLKSKWEQHINDPTVTNYVYGEGALAPLTAANNPAGDIFNAHVDYDVRQYAVFGEGSYALRPDLKLTLGLRYYNFKTNVGGEQDGIFTQYADTVPAPIINTQSASGFNPKVNLSYTPTGDLTVYATAAKGFRPGGDNLPVPLTGPNNCTAALTADHLSLTNLTYNPDTLWSYELGEKARLADGRVTLNSAIYYIKWSNIQESVPLSCGDYLTENSGDARSYGSEVELNAKLNANWTGSASGAYTNATINKPSASSPIPAGTPLLNVPKYTGNLALIYTQPLSDKLSLTARTSVTYYGSSLDEAFTYVNLPSYTLVAARLGLAADRWDVHLYCNNLTDKRALLTGNTSSFSFSIPDVTRFASNQPRTIGINVSAKF